ncbi:enoyl-CoA hydratase/isomerase family protein [Paramicrobacterium chengjingii]|uniref:Enoyl-CoA hydratase/isomerase family protein n=1 Tax=Paramicrobacterium chengjingii TaxID=2769067 RepID=A0ABX6YKV7_9MICO|nr:enoyl-CoA hydratase-related protein [Microbacterium chengjingii]QPZ39295.1 enoyl-CoA hydratase/isomerase family protein [Microbacterium chengjingii]
MTHENDEAVTVEIDGAVATMTFNQPEKRNSFTDKMLFDSLDRIEALVDDENVRILVLTGAGRYFSVGGDLDEFAAGEFQPADVPIGTSVAKLRRFMQLSQYLRESRLITIAAVNGACAGAGLSVAAACDLRVSSERAVFRAAFLDAGLSGDFGGTWSLSRLLGEAKAKEFYMLNDRVSPQEALRIGLVSRVFPEEGFLDQALSLAHDIASKPPVALDLIKKNLTDTTTEFSVACDREALHHVLSGNTADAIEAAAAFLEKREPQFIGR